MGGRWEGVGEDDDKATTTTATCLGAGGRDWRSRDVLFRRSQDDLQVDHVVDTENHFVFVICLCLVYTATIFG